MESAITNTEIEALASGIGIINSKLDRPGLNRGYEYPAIDIYKADNHSEANVTHQESKEMLNDWREKTSQERPVLKKALENASLLWLADKHLGDESGEEEDKSDDEEDKSDEDESNEEDDESEEEDESVEDGSDEEEDESDDFDEEGYESEEVQRHTQTQIGGTNAINASGQSNVSGNTMVGEQTNVYNSTQSVCLPALKRQANPIFGPAQKRQKVTASRPKKSTTTKRKSKAKSPNASRKKASKTNNASKVLKKKAPKSATNSKKKVPNTVTKAKKKAPKTASKVLMKKAPMTASKVLKKKVPMTANRPRVTQNIHPKATRPNIQKSKAFGQVRAVRHMKKSKR